MLTMDNNAKKEEVVCKNCGLIDDYSIVIKSGHQVAFCNGCDNYIKSIAYQDLLALRMFMGKYKGKRICDIDDVSYLRWAYDNMTALKPRYLEAIDLQIVSLCEKKEVSYCSNEKEL